MGLNDVVKELETLRAQPGYEDVQDVITEVRHRIPRLLMKKAGERLVDCGEVSSGAKEEAVCSSQR